MALGLLAVGEEAGGFDDDVDTELLPWERGGPLRDGKAFDFVPVYDQGVVFSGSGRFFTVDLALESALRRVAGTRSFTAATL